MTLKMAFRNSKYSSHFIRNYKKLSLNLKLRFEFAERIFKLDIFDTRLKTHKLNGKFEGLWSFSVDSRYRVIFDFYKKDIIRFHSVGSHDIYR